MLNTIPGQPQDPLFSIPKDGHNVALTYDQLRKLLYKWVALTGRDETGYSPHCLCRGGCTRALESDLSGEDIKLMGDWASIICIILT